MNHEPRPSDDPSPSRPTPVVPCPACGTKTRFEPANPWRPFCSERCKTRDFGAWASESYRVQAVEPPDDGIEG
ncbi:hypothetical protein C7444_10563 [Sphaerotilus hippei]|uniref:DNA gyrase inhibitor YacG n=1 Tax=Sphaerotilus hippei TaxID=744406 RepID=A0A318H4J1_9BURK|nr:DNA gyrase inhibitor YacG [Sphaerotilus hippei]PXW96966.1 hypothetical protein C7444_10563 [Sphaerotilus hippei]